MDDKLSYIAIISLAFGFSVLAYVLTGFANYHGADPSTSWAPALVAVVLVVLHAVATRNDDVPERTETMDDLNAEGGH